MRLCRVTQFPLLSLCTATLQARQGRAAHTYRLPACLCCWLCLSIAVCQLSWRAETAPTRTPWDQGTQ